MKQLFLTLFLFLGFALPSANAQAVGTETHAFTKADNVLWASPEGFDLTMDIYTPKTDQETYPVLVMFHGGGWLINNETIMDEAAAYLASHGAYVVCNVNYRLLGDLNNSVTMNEIVEDALGATLWVKEHIKAYGGDASQLIVTGDSAGGHLAAMVAVQGDALSSTGFETAPLGFNPTWLPPGKTAEEMAATHALQVQGAILSYGAFDIYSAAQGGFEKSDNFFWQMGGATARGLFGENITVESAPEFYKKVSPLYNVPPASQKELPPMLFTVGSEDTTTTPESIEAYIQKLEAAGHDDLHYWVHQDRPHAFLDSGSNEFLNINFQDDAIPALEVMLTFLNRIFY